MSESDQRAVPTASKRLTAELNWLDRCSGESFSFGDFSVLRPAARVVLAALAAAEARIAELEAERAHVVTQSNALAEAARGLRVWITKNRRLIRAEIDEDVAQMKSDIGEAEALIAEVQAAVPVPAEEPSNVHKPFDDDGVVYCGWAFDHGVHEGCGEVWPCSTVRAAQAAAISPATPEETE